MEHKLWFEITRYYADKLYLDYNFTKDMFYDDDQVLSESECKFNITSFVYRDNNIFTIIILIGNNLKRESYTIQYCKTIFEIFKIILKIYDLYKFEDLESYHAIRYGCIEDDVNGWVQESFNFTKINLLTKLVDILYDEILLQKLYNIETELSFDFFKPVIPSTIKYFNV